jgi:hypothetical protein
VFYEFQARIHEPERNSTLEWAYANGSVLISCYHFIAVSEELKVTKDQTAVRKLEMHGPYTFNKLT